MTTTYQIRIKGHLYEGSDNYDDALRLYKTVDKTCLKQYHGATKTLVKVIEGREEILKSDKIKSPTPGVRM